jgi:hypothetical protein
MIYVCIAISGLTRTSSEETEKFIRLRDIRYRRPRDPGIGRRCGSNKKAHESDRIVELPSQRHGPRKLRRALFRNEG